ncbi:unnamed protein product [Plutella xylostella]|uniref:Transmembrane protein 198 n=1 Tax=Plutella xylostella TaxID=51655 RepID=A0A8S4GBT7_PLUXY|nr:unnamed protein product [Plutella xylostella]
MSSEGLLVPVGPRGAPNTTTQLYGPHIRGTHCPPMDYRYDPIKATICAMYIVFGIVYTLFGYRCFKASMFLTGFTFGSAIVYLICLQEHLMPPYGNICVSLCAGVLFGLITMLIQYVGLFMTGFHTGLLLALAGLAVADRFITSAPPTYWLCVLSLLGSGIFFAVVNLYWKKVLTILGTAVYGGALLAACLDYYAERLRTLQWVWERAKLEPWAAPCAGWAGWAALVAWPAAAALGLAAQAALTRRQVFHEQSISAQKRLAAAAARGGAAGGAGGGVSRQQRADLRQRKYRYLYQLRTAHGDVISQSYVQALQKKAMCRQWGAGGGAAGGAGGGSGGGSTLQSDCTRLTALPDALPDDDDLQEIHRQ